jgi:hypothetical protein
LQNKIFPLLAEGFDGTITNLHERMVVLLELVRWQHAGIDRGVGGGGRGDGGIAAAVNGGEAAPQAAATRVVRRPGGAAHPSSVFCKQEIMVENQRQVSDPYSLNPAVLRIRAILEWIWIRGSMPLTNGSGSGSCYFRH